MMMTTMMMIHRTQHTTHVGRGAYSRTTHGTARRPTRNFMRSGQRVDVVSVDVTQWL